MATNNIRTMATPIAAPITRFLRLSREAASVRKSSSPLAGIVPARMMPLREPVCREKIIKGVERSWEQVYHWAKYNRESKMADSQRGNNQMNGSKRNNDDVQGVKEKILQKLLLKK